MAVVISGVNNNDKITATDGTIDLLSGVNFSGEVEVPSFKVGSNIQFGNAGIITATTLVGNVQGNINHTSNLLLQISGSEKFRVGTSGQLGIGGANYGTSGQVLTSGGSGSAASWSTLSTDLVSDSSPQLGGNLDVNTKNIIFGDSGGTTDDRLTFGAGTDLSIYHDGSNSYVKNSTGALLLNSDIFTFTDAAVSKNGLSISVNGSTNFYWNGTRKAYTHTTGFVFEDSIRIADSDKIEIGDIQDLQIYHNGTNSYIDNSTGSLYIRDTSGGDVRIQGKNGEDSIICNDDGSVELYHDNTKRLETTSSGVEIPQALFVGEKIDMPDHTSGTNGMILLGTGDDLFMYHDGTNSHLRNNTGTFNVRAGNFRLTDAAIQHVYLNANGNGNDEISLYYDNSVKLTTTSSGISVTGNSIASEIGKQKRLQFHHLTSTQRDALSAVEGEIIYNTTTDKHEFYTASSAWAPVSAQAPEFDNASGSLATFYSESRSYVTPTSPTASGDAPITYTIASGSLPSGMSINSSTGVLSGTPNAVGSDTTSNFTVRASNAGGGVERDYSITVKAPVTTNYSYTGSTVNWSKPSSDVKRVLFRMWGGAGTHGTCTSNSQYPGRGGKTEGVINVESHNTLYLQVGEAGGDTSSGPNGGWPNGGNGNISHQCKGSGGGGSSNIYHSSGTGSYTYIVAVAGGGGSVSHGNPNSNGGDGGGTNGQSSNRGGGGGSQNAGGSQGSTPCGNTGNSGTGTRLQGGTAGTGSGCTNAGAGGGGGWWGGGAGGNSNSGNTYGGGGGGSGYFDTSLVSGGSTKQASESGWDTNRPSGIAGRASYGNNNRGGHGYITLIY